MEQILTASQVADMLQVHLRTVYKLARKGLVPGRKFGGGWRFSRDEIVRMLSGGQAGLLEVGLADAKKTL
ncbi:MAG: hypothetical protein A3F90_02850 [Deltaproteobacteria bacterium RIFCSPLOWO2_12_FULL_60_19]|nr:MAG: hypothetical protein A3F90_02850 [Deltaproteobacteria bacterium RIFCSPLOWO2_12_FULL_60_19]